MKRPRRERRRDFWAWIGLALLLVAFAAATQKLFSSRYWAGDVHPRFSSLSSAPEGTRALYEALAALPGRELARNHRPLGRLADDWAAPPETTLLFTGWPSWQVAGGEEVPEALDRLASAGARIVLTVASDETWAPGREEIQEADEPGEGDDSGPADESADEPATRTSDEGGFGSPEAAERASRWAFEILESDQQVPTARRVAGVDAGGLPDEVSWRSPLSLILLDDAWTALYAADGRPVLAERRFGDAGGSVVLAAGSYFLTNQAQSEDRQVELLARLLGRTSRVVFDEAHLGLVSTPGVVALGRRYRLHGVALALAAVLGLAIWRGVTRVMPPPEAEAPRPTAARGNHEGLVALLRRGIPERRLLQVCLEQWSATQSGESASEEVRRISREADPVDGYRRLSELLDPQKRSR